MVLQGGSSDVVLCCLFGVRVSVTFHLTSIFVHIFFSSAKVAESPPFGKELLTRLTICSLCILNICNFCISCFGFERGIWVLIAPVPGHCILVTFLLLSVLFPSIR